MRVEIFTDAAQGVSVPINVMAANMVRLHFNPDGIAQIDRIKALAAALVSECHILQRSGGPGAREASVAITHIQGGTFFAIEAARTAIREG